VIRIRINVVPIIIGMNISNIILLKYFFEIKTESNHLQTYKVFKTL